MDLVQLPSFIGIIFTVIIIRVLLGISPVEQSMALKNVPQSCEIATIGGTRQRRGRDIELGRTFTVPIAINVTESVQVDNQYGSKGGSRDLNKDSRET
jgi:hypothetical protein